MIAESPDARVTAPPTPAPEHAQPARHLARGALAVLSTQPFTWAASLASVILVPRVLGADGLGRFSIAWAIGTFAGGIAATGLRTFVGRRVAAEPDSAGTYTWSAFAVSAGYFVVVAALVMAILALLRPAAVDLAIVALALSGAFLWTIQGIVTAVLMSTGRHIRYALTSASFSIVGTLGGLVALVAGAGAHGYGLGLLAGWAVMTGILVVGSGLPVTRSAVQVAYLREVLVGSVPFLGTNLALSVRGQTDVVITGLLLQPGIAGWLAAAYRITNVAVFIPSAIAAPLLPALTSVRAAPGRYASILGTSVTTTLLLIVPICGAIFSLAPVIPGLLGWPAELDHAVPLMRILAFQQVIVAVDMMLVTGYIALGRERTWLRVTLIGAVFNPVVNLAAIPVAQALTENGAIGAAIVEVATELLFMCAVLFLMPGGTLGRREVSAALRVVVCGLGLVGVATVLLPAGPLVAGAAGGLTYVGLAITLRLLRPQQLQMLRMALRRT